MDTLILFHRPQEVSSKHLCPLQTNTRTYQILSWDGSASLSLRWGLCPLPGLWPSLGGPSHTELTPPFWKWTLLQTTERKYGCSGQTVFLKVPCGGPVRAGSAASGKAIQSNSLINTLISGLWFTYSRPVQMYILHVLLYIICPSCSMHKACSWEFLAVQWLALHTLTAEDPGVPSLVED